MRAVKSEHRERRRETRDETRERGAAKEKRRHQPEESEDDKNGPGEGKCDTEIGRDTLAAFEAQPDRKDVAEKSAETGRECGVGPKEIIREQHREGAFQEIAEQCRGGDPLIAGAKHIGGADIARTDRAAIAATGEPRQL